MRRRLGVEDKGWCRVDGLFLGEDLGLASLLDTVFIRLIHTET